MDQTHRCSYKKPTTHRQCNEYATGFLALPTGEYIPVCEKHAASVRRLYENQYGKDNVKFQRRLME